jgi:tetratricopeptide (TPR) repeat protein
MASSISDSSGQIEPKDYTDIQQSPRKLYNKIIIMSKLFFDSLEVTYKRIFLIFKLLITFTLVCSIAIYGWHLAHWMFYQDDAIDIQPFVIRDVTLREDTGAAIADHLRFELVRIKQINEQKITEPYVTPRPTRSTSPTSISGSTNLLTTTTSIHSPPVAPSTNLDLSISQLGTVGGGGFSFSLGQILLSLKELSGNRKNAIKGSFQKYGPNLSMVAILGGSFYDSKGSMAWEVKRIMHKENSSLTELIPDMVDELAFRIAHATSKGEKPQTWQAFKYCTLANEAYVSYNATGNASDLDEATSYAKRANCCEPHYFGSIELLGNLEKAWNNKGNALSERKKYDEALIAYNKGFSLNDTIMEPIN